MREMKVTSELDNNLTHIKVISLIKIGNLKEESLSSINKTMVFLKQTSYKLGNLEMTMPMVIIL